MKERPILFSGPMVRELLAGRKTQTRRPVKPQPPTVEAVQKRSGSGYHLFAREHRPDVWGVAGPVWAVREETGCVDEWRCPYGAPGDRLWVRETLRRGPKDTWVYAADDAKILIPRDDDERVLAMHIWVHHKDSDTCVSIHMPRWASRLLLEVESVRVERLQAITEEDARAEGMENFHAEMQVPTLRDVFRLRWAGMYDGTDFAPERNPWVWAVTFRRVDAARSAA